MRVGIIGTGQLGWMMVIEGRKLGIEFNVLGSDREAPASRVADHFYQDQDYRKFVDDSDVVTAEFEHVDPSALEYAQDMGKLFPTSKIEEVVGVIQYKDPIQEGDSLSIEKLQKQSLFFHRVFSCTVPFHHNHLLMS